MDVEFAAGLDEPSGLVPRRLSVHRVPVDESLWFRGAPERQAAVLLSGKEATRVIDSATGETLHEPWERGAWSVQWIDSSDDARVVEVRPVGVPMSVTQVLDLDSGARFDIERDHAHPLLHPIGPRGYVFVRRDGDLVWVDVRGALVEVLIDR